MQRDVIFCRSDAGGVVGRFRVGNKARIGEQGGGRSADFELRDVAAGIDGRLTVLGSDHDQSRIVETSSPSALDECANRCINELDFAQQRPRQEFQ